MEKERIIKDKLQRLIEGIKKADYKDCDKEHMARLAEERINELQQRGVNCVDSYVQKLLDRIGDKKAYLDILMEGRFAVILARNNFAYIHIEYAEKGPDLKARWNRKTVYFEVTRRHSEVDEWAEESEDNLPPPDKPEDIISKIQGKLKQLKHNEINIVVYWSASMRVLELNMAEAFRNIQQEISQNPGMYKKLSGVLFTEDGGVSYGRLSPFRLYKNDKASRPLGTRLAQKLKSLHERNPKQLKREFDALADALQRLRSSYPTTP